MDFSEFVSSDEHLGSDEFDEYLDDEVMSDNELDELDGTFSSFSDSNHSDLWEDLSEVNEDDIPY